LLDQRRRVVGVLFRKEVATLHHLPLHARCPLAPDTERTAVPLIYRRAVELDPVDPLTRGSLITGEYYAGHLNEVATMIRSLPPNMLDAVSSSEELLDEYLALGRFADAETLVPRQAAPVEELRGRALHGDARWAAFLTKMRLPH
jgi:hypothetical protein